MISFLYWFTYPFLICVLNTLLLFVLLKQFNSFIISYRWGYQMLDSNGDKFAFSILLSLSIFIIVWFFNIFFLKIVLALLIMIGLFIILMIAEIIYLIYFYIINHNKHFLHHIITFSGEEQLDTDINNQYIKSIKGLEILTKINNYYLPKYFKLRKYVNKNYIHLSDNIINQLNDKSKLILHKIDSLIEDIIKKENANYDKKGKELIKNINDNI